MYSYEMLRREKSQAISQTIDSPIMLFDYLELSDAFLVIGIVFFFGVILYSWELMLFFLVLFLIVGPYIKRRNHRGVFFHWPYRHWGISLPGLINPKGRRRFSD